MADEVAVTDEVAATDESRLLRRDLGDRRCTPPLNLGSRRGAARKQIDSPPSDCGYTVQRFSFHNKGGGADVPVADTLVVIAV